MKVTSYKLLVILSICTGLNACVAPGGNIDPYEKFNRKVFTFNQSIDRIAIRPLAKLYLGLTPHFIASGINNAFQNLSELTNIANDALQLDIQHTITDSSRFIVNTTFGLLGTIDVASDAGLAYHYQDFGLTLNRWGVRETPYLMLPFFGPHTVSSALGLPVDYSYLSIWPYIHDTKVITSMYGLYIINDRADLLHADDLIEQAFDPYIFIRDAYMQQRAALERENEPSTGKLSDMVRRPAH